MSLYSVSGPLYSLSGLCMVCRGFVLSVGALHSLLLMPLPWHLRLCLMPVPWHNRLCLSNSNSGDSVHEFTQSCLFMEIVRYVRRVSYPR